MKKCPICSFDVDENLTKYKLKKENEIVYFCGPKCMEEYQGIKEEKKDFTKIFESSKVLAIVGLSPNEARTSYQVAAKLKGFGYEIIPVYPKAEIILGEKVYKSILDIEKEIDTAIFFINSKLVYPLVKEAIEKKVKTIWLQEGVISKESKKMAFHNNINFVMDRCFYKEHINYINNKNNFN
ncbi:hypothetical protein EV215_0082 [Hypnocyclicus thermotrophus]|uniref:CoA-binding domain-containing protein n=1 Tax=Hypnocyclicus thermotrophus TaxID=1627895 RepID=A0AA46I689_9FUSO|nr:CoA-binding protein [Hypnocyclicus thermotrophus]TDT72294.1 hypothetical protein EV215_0082 [Hypnocyclicus thermotrophus]